MADMAIEFLKDPTAYESRLDNAVQLCDKGIVMAGSYRSFSTVY